MRRSMQLKYAGFTHQQQEMVLHKLQELSNCTSNEMKPKSLENIMASHFNRNDIHDVIDYITMTFETSGDVKYLTWALLEPLVIYWQLLLRLTEVNESASKIASFLSLKIHDWLSRVPIPSSFDISEEESVRNDLSYLAHSIFTIPSIRREFGKRFLEIYKNKTPFDLEKLLLDCDYLYYSGEGS
jgi:hypothetical protein